MSGVVNQFSKHIDAGVYAACREFMPDQVTISPVNYIAEPKNACTYPWEWTGNDMTTGGEWFRAAHDMVRSACMDINDDLVDFVAKTGASESQVILSVCPAPVPVLGGVRGDVAVDRFTSTDPVSGVAFEFALYLGYMMVSLKMSMRWDFTVREPLL